MRSIFPVPLSPMTEMVYSCGRCGGTHVEHNWVVDMNTRETMDSVSYCRDCDAICEVTLRDEGSKLLDWGIGDPEEE